MLEHRVPVDLLQLLDQDSGGRVAADLCINAEDGLKLWTRHPYDALVYWLSKQEQLAKLIRFHKAQAGVPILALMPDREDVLRRMALQLGATTIAALGDGEPATLSKHILQVLDRKGFFTSARTPGNKQP